MIEREQFVKGSEPNEELLKLIEEAREREITDEEFKAQTIGFIYGNGMNIKGITKESARRAVESPLIRLKKSD